MKKFNKNRNNLNKQKMKTNNYKNNPFYYNKTLIFRKNNWNNLIININLKL